MKFLKDNPVVPIFTALIIVIAVIAAVVVPASSDKSKTSEPGAPTKPSKWIGVKNGQYYGEKVIFKLPTEKTEIVSDNLQNDSEFIDFGKGFVTVTPLTSDFNGTTVEAEYPKAKKIKNGFILSKRRAVFFNKSIVILVDADNQIIKSFKAKERP